MGLGKDGQTMQRYFVASGQFGDNCVTVVGEDARHIARVMRFRPGERIICCDG
ncbi:MAG TPA: RNA methyltransferase PUA domain-containing protein, partial [Bacilli bacterium]